MLHQFKGAHARMRRNRGCSVQISRMGTLKRFGSGSVIAGLSAVMRPPLQRLIGPCRRPPTPAQPAVPVPTTARHRGRPASPVCPRPCARRYFASARPNRSAENLSCRAPDSPRSAGRDSRTDRSGAAVRTSALRMPPRNSFSTSSNIGRAECLPATRPSAASALRCRVDAESQLGREAHGTQHAHRVLAVTLDADRPSAAAGRLQVLHAADVIHHREILRCCNTGR